MSSDAAAHLSAALDSLRTALIAGDLAALPGLAETLERLCPDAASGLALAELEALRARARTAGVMLEATARGLRAARRRVDEVAQAGRGLATYDRSGQRRQIGAAMASLPRRI